MADKDTYNVDETYNGTQPHYVDPSGIESKEGRITEAAALYGDIQTAEEYGYVTRGYVRART
jgi:amino acid transporter